MEGSVDPVLRNSHAETNKGCDPSKVDKDGAGAKTSKTNDDERFEIDLLLATVESTIVHSSERKQRPGDACK